MRSGSLRRVALVVAGSWSAIAMVAAGAGPAAADPAGPTDYRSTIVEVEPPLEGIELRILGGDSFVELAAEPGVEVRVVGYRGEPYLWFDTDGTVWQNESSSSRWLNDDRYGEADVPPEADDDAEPTWVAVADDGVFAWHDHRAHWMNPDRPLGAEPGDTVLEAVIPVEVDGTGTRVHVRSVLLAGPSPLPAVAGAVLALAAAAVAVGWGRRRGSWFRYEGERVRRPAGPLGLLVVAWSVLAVALGLAAVAGLPSVAAPGPSRWLLPAVAALLALGAVVVGERRLLAPPLRALVMPGLLAVAGLELVLWAWLRRQVVVRALVPSSAPAWLDRFGVVGAAAAGLVALAAGAALLIRELRPAPRP